jgi:hypothetical protein
MSKRPTIAEVQASRVAAVAAILLVITAGMQLYNRLADSCGLGAKTQRVIAALVHGQIHSTADLSRAYGFGTRQRTCDFIFPMISHSPSVLWPSHDDLIGCLIYVVAMALMVLVAVAYRYRANNEQALYLDRLVIQDAAEVERDKKI